MLASTFLVKFEYLRNDGTFIFFHKTGRIKHLLIIY
jgi:hypothetical protein